MTTFHPLLAPYQPTSDDPFDATKAAHLLNRAGFGGTPDEVAHVAEIGAEAALDELLDFPDAPAEEQDEHDVPDLSGIDGFPTTFRKIAVLLAGKTRDEKLAVRQQLMAGNRQALIATGAWWMKRMAYGPHPFQEKLALFWHGHFTTSARDEQLSLLMWRQNELLRQNAAGNFGTFLHQISRDPAMLDYLNNTQNRKAHPNENYAREVMELFTLGIGNYTETDVKQGARAFTGWSHDGDVFVFRPFQHDYGIKTFLGYTGNFDGDDVLNIILSKPDCSRFIATEIFKYFVYEDVDDKLSAALGQTLAENQYELRPLFRTIFNSKAFYSKTAIGAQIKNPVQLIVGTVRQLNLMMPPIRPVMGALNQMGQVPFLPPNVRGWPGGRTWINTSTMFVRYNTGVWLTGGEVPALGMGKPFGGGKRGMAERYRRGDQVNFAPANTAVADSAEAVVAEWLNRLIQRPVDDSQKKVLVAALGDDPHSEWSVRKMVQLIVSMPEYQLC